MDLSKLRLKKSILSELVYTVCFAVILGMMAIPFATVSYEAGDVFESLDVQFLTALSGGTVTLGGNNFTLFGSMILLLIGLITICLSEVIIIANYFFSNKKINILLNSVGLVFALTTLFLFMLAGYLIYPLDFGSQEGYSAMTYNPFGITISVFSLIMALINFSNIFSYKKYTVQEISETAFMVALAVVLDQFVKIPIQANGGSISFAAFPLFVIAIRYGAFKGFIASGFVFGFLTCLLDGYGFQTFPFDYLVALSGYGLIGTFFNFAKRFYKNIEDKSKYRKMQFIYSAIAIALAGIPIMIIRYFGHMIDGALLYNFDFWPNFVYQSTYVPGAVWVSIATMIILLEPVLLINKIFPVKKVVEVEEISEEK